MVSFEKFELDSMKAKLSGIFVPFALSELWRWTRRSLPLGLLRGRWMGRLRHQIFHGKPILMHSLLTAVVYLVVLLVHPLVILIQI